MSIAPAPSSSRGALVLQPGYFTSSIYVNALRDDITTLIALFHEQYLGTQPAQPFALFKTIWISQGWKWMHFKIFEDRSRKAFLDVTLRLLLERTVKTEAPFNRTAALFALYTFFYTQPLETMPSLYNVSYIPIPIDEYMALKLLPGILATPELQPLKMHADYVLSTLLEDQVFLIVPRSDLGPLNPRSLPREIYVDPDTVMPVDSSAPKKKGRPTKRDKAQRTKAAVEALDEWTREPSRVTLPASSSNYASMSHMGVASQGASAALQAYQSEKRWLLQSLEDAPENIRAGVAKANALVVERLREAQELLPNEDGRLVRRVEQAAATERGVLGLLGDPKLRIA